MEILIAIELRLSDHVETVVLMSRNEAGKCDRKVFAALGVKFVMRSLNPMCVGEQIDGQNCISHGVRLDVYRFLILTMEVERNYGMSKAFGH